jgi:acetyl-CoA carboxylase biotin carboxylase subunit
VWEEAPAKSLDPEIREVLCASAVRLGRSVDYRGAGTLEYLFDKAAQQSFFIEMNTRIQVEHLVTERITGVDLVAEMIRIANGQRLSFVQADVQACGHVLECRINAEDPSRQFAPAPGVIANTQIAGGPGVRFDGMIYSGYQVPSLLGKLIVDGETRDAALGRLRQALREMRIAGGLIV